MKATRTTAERGRRPQTARACAKPSMELPPPRVAQGGMPLLLPEHGDGLEEIALCLFSPDAKAVCVAGSFNDWQPAATPLEKKSGGSWEVHLRLKSGSHEYRFVVDGEWRTDPLAARFVSNPYGDLNGVIEIA